MTLQEAYVKGLVTRGISTYMAEAMVAAYRAKKIINDERWSQEADVNSIDLVLVGLNSVSSLTVLELLQHQKKTGQVPQGAKMELAFGFGN